MATFAAFNIATGKELSETIIRLPLRTTEQAAKSKIKEHATSVEDVKKILTKFCKEVAEGGLLFLKHIRNVVVRVDKTVLLSATVSKNTDTDSKTRDALPADFRNMYVTKTSKAKSLSRTFQTDIEYHTSKGSRSDTYLVQHLMAHSCGDSELDSWAKDLKLFPWVAIAAPISTQNSTFVGKLFSTLSLGSHKTMQPVHIHGLFAIAPDRARLGSEDQAVRWNTSMFQSFVATAWVQLLQHRNQLSCLAEGFALWPSVDIATSDLWTTVDEFVLRQIIKNEVPVWNTLTRRCVRLEEGYLTTTESNAKKFADPLSKAQLPIVNLEQSFLSKVQQIARELSRDFKMMTPKTVRSFLRRQSGMPTSHDDEACLILEFCLSDATGNDADKTFVYKDMQSLALWPILDGKLSKASGLFLPRDSDEMAIFLGARDHCTVDLDRLSEPTRKIVLRDILLLGPNLRHRSCKDLAPDWPKLYAVSDPSDSETNYINRPCEQDTRLRNIWTWLLARHDEEKRKFPSDLHQLWLVPLMRNQIRRLAPSGNADPTLIIGGAEHVVDLLSRMVSQSAKPAPPVLDNEMMSAGGIDRVKKSLSRDPTYHFASTDQLYSLVHWLVSARENLLGTTRDDKKTLLAHLEKLVRDYLYSEKPPFALQSQISKLPLFNVTTSLPPYTHRMTITTSLDKDGRYYELPLHLPALPDIRGIFFVDLSNGNEKYILEELGVIGRMSNEQLLIKYLIPWMQITSEEDSVKRALADWIMLNSKFAEESWIENVLGQPVIPLSISSSKEHGTYARLPDLVDRRSTYAELYFDHEGVFPDENFYQKHKAALLACHIGNGIRFDTPLERARVYSKSDAPVEMLIPKVESLFKVPLDQQVTLSENSVQEIRCLKWVPGISTQGEAVMLSPDKCRGVDDSSLVDHVWGKTKFYVPFASEWRKILGWEQIPKEVLLEQLDHCISNDEKSRVDKLLAHMKPTDASALSSKPFILGSHGTYLKPSRAFSSSCELRTYPLSPHIDQVDANFARRHAPLLEALEVESEPSIQVLRDVQDRLLRDSRGILASEELKIAINTLEVATRLYRNSDELAMLLIPDRSSTLREILDIVHGDGLSSGGTADFHFCHGDISQSLISRLGIEDAFERATRMNIEFEDEDENEYTQSESLSTIIDDTLTRYPIESTWNEYLSNADDGASFPSKVFPKALSYTHTIQRALLTSSRRIAAASKIAWTIDECQQGHYSTQYLLTQKLQPFQGPALFVWNDEVFQEKDFQGFRDIGRGGKSDDILTTGQFGRGGLTMYHISDVPMIVSGDYVLILDPQQCCLPKSSKHRKRMAGVKISIARMQEQWPDQLTIFEGLHGFNKDLYHYEGTIFRFALRTDKAKTGLRDSTCNISIQMVKDLMYEYSEAARMSLLFLRNIASIEFYIRGKEQPEWCVSARRSENPDEEVFQNVTVSVTKGARVEKYEWRVGVTDVDPRQVGIVRTGKGSSKLTECGIAACTSHERYQVDEEETPQPRPELYATSLPKSSDPDIDQKVFCRLPSEKSQLPVSFHGSFIITGDRRTITVEGQDSAAMWNRWLLRDCTANFYLAFLQNLAARIGEQAFSFWPTMPRAGSEGTLSGIVAEAFWSKATSHEHKLDKLFPLLENGSPCAGAPSTNLRQPKTRKMRRLHSVTNVEDARFDFLSEEISIILRPLFALLGLPLVRPSVEVGAVLRDSATDMKVIALGSPLLCRIFKSEANCRHLERFLAEFESDEDKANALAIFYDLLIPKVDTEPLTVLNDLDGCRILPRPKLDASLGLLTLYADTDEQQTWHFEATLEEQKLFSFAAEHMVNTRLSKRSRHKPTDFDDILGAWNRTVSNLTNSSLNVRKFVIADIGFLLGLPGSPARSGVSLQGRDEWIVKLWKYINFRFGGQTAVSGHAKSSQEVLEGAKLSDHAVYRSMGTQSFQYLTPREFESGSYIVEPAIAKQQSICAEITGLICVDPNCLPKGLVLAEADLSKAPSFARFLRALDKLGGARKTHIKSFLATKLTSQSRNVILQLLDVFLDSYNDAKDVPNRPLLRALPVWPRVKRPENKNLSQYIAAEDALFCKHSSLFVAWARDLQTCVAP